MKQIVSPSRFRAIQSVADHRLLRQASRPATKYNASILAGLNSALERLSAAEILSWACKTWTKVAVSSSFQTQSVPLLHIISIVCPQVPVIFIDTGFHFPETLAFRDELQARFGLNVVVVGPAAEKRQPLAKNGSKLYRRDPDLCCYKHKVEPMRRALSAFQVWIAGIRRHQTPHRQHLRMLETRPIHLIKIHPLLNWSKRELWAYIHKHKLPHHPLFSKGYLSIGCAPCTRPVLTGENERAGRWAGIDKTECGLHIDWTDHTKAQGNQTAV